MWKVIIIILLVLSCSMYALSMSYVTKIDTSLKKQMINNNMNVVGDAIFNKIKQVVIEYGDGTSDGVLYADVKTVKIVKVNSNYSRNEKYFLKLEVLRLRN